MAGAKKAGQKVLGSNKLGVGRVKSDLFFFDVPLMRIITVLGYTFSAFLYLMAWWNPAIGAGEGLVRWVAFEKLCLTEFLTVHATTLLGAIALAAQLEKSEETFALIFWICVGFYFVLGGGAYLFHQDRGALLGFYLMLAIRGSQLLSLQTPDPDVMRAQVIKNFAMIVPLFFLVGFISISDDLFSSWQSTFIQGHLSFVQKIVKGRDLLVVTAYYLLWAFVEWKWPLRIANE